MGNCLRNLVASLTVLSLAALFVPGCALPAHVGRDYVSSELLTRTGHAIDDHGRPPGAPIPDIANWQDGLSEDEAAALAIWNNPSYQELLVDLQITQAELIQAHQIPNPNIITMLPLSAKQWELTVQVPLDVLVLRPRRVAAAQLEMHRVGERLVQDGLNVIRDVRTAYVNLAQAEETLRLAQQGLELRRETTRIAKARLEAGADAELGVSVIELEQFTSDDQVNRAERDVALARQRLRFLVGFELTDTEFSTTPLSDVPTLDTEVDELVALALSARPDLRSVELAIDAASDRARLARHDYFNIWGLLPDINSRGAKGFEAGPGLLMTLPIFNQNQAAIARTEAAIERLRRQHTTLRDTVAMEVRQAYTTLIRAQQELDIWRNKAVPRAELTFASVQEALKEDAVQLLMVVEATRTLLATRQREIQAAADVRRAVAELERSIGHRLLDESTGNDEAEELLPPSPTFDIGALIQ